jgi:hypothetical protein
VHKDAGQNGATGKIEAGLQRREKRRKKEETGYHALMQAVGKPLFLSWGGDVPLYNQNLALRIFSTERRALLYKK